MINFNNNLKVLEINYDILPYMWCEDHIQTYAIIQMQRIEEKRVILRSNVALFDSSMNHKRITMCGGGGDGTHPKSM